MDDLESCPFCGTNNLWLGQSFVTSNWRVMCQECRAAGPDAPDAAQAASAWNTRPRTNGRERVDVVAWGYVSEDTGRLLTIDPAYFGKPTELLGLKIVPLVFA